MCRMALVAPMAVHRASFYPTAVIGALGAATAVGKALRRSPQQLTDAISIAGSFASGIIEYLAEGSWTKRAHPGWAAQSGLRAALLGWEGFAGPRTVLEGQHGFFRLCRPLDHTRLIDWLGAHWQAATIAFKPYACGTMAQPFIDCAIRLAKDSVKPADIAAITCKAGEGTVHRLWEKLAEKQAPITPYSAKFSVPYCIAVGLTDSAAGLGQFTEDRIRDPKILALAAKVNYEIDPQNEYPANYSRHIHATLTDGAVREVEQPHLRGGAREPLSRTELEIKFRANTEFGGWTNSRSDALKAFGDNHFDAPNLSGLAAFRG